MIKGYKINNTNEETNGIWLVDRDNHAIGESEAFPGLTEYHMHIIDACL